MRSPLCYIIVLWLVPGILLAQNTPNILHSYFKEVRSGKYNSIPKNLSLPENAKSTLSGVSPYLKDSSAVVRAKAYAIVQLVGDYSRQATVREDAVMKLVEACKDKDSGNAGLAMGYLDDFMK